MVEEPKTLSKDCNFRLAFIMYIKSSEWLDQLAFLVPFALQKHVDAFPGKGRLFKQGISSYQMATEKLLEVEFLVCANSLKFFSRSLSNPTTPTNSERKGTINLESYFNIEDSKCFHGEQYLAIFLSILLPIFLVALSTVEFCARMTAVLWRLAPLSWRFHPLWSHQSNPARQRCLL